MTAPPGEAAGKAAAPPAEAEGERQTLFLRRRQSRNRAMIFVLLALVALFYLVTIAKILSSSG